MNLDNFYKHKTPDGFHTWCKECNRKQSSNWQKTNPKKHAKLKNRYYHDGRSTHWQKQNGINRRLNGKQKEWQQSNPDKCRYYSSKHSNKKHIMTTKEWEANKKYFIHRCAYCGLAIEDHWVQVRGNWQLGDFHKEHVIDDGRNDIKNCVPSCKSCNSEKHTSTLNQWYNPSNPKYTQERYYRIYIWMRYDYKKYIEPKKKNITR